MLAWPLVFCFISVPEWQNGSLLQEMLNSQKRTSCFYGSLKREVGFKKKRKNKIWINIFQLVSQSRKHVQTLFHRLLAVEIPPGWPHSSSSAMKGCWTPGELHPLALPRALAAFRASLKCMAGFLHPPERGFGEEGHRWSGQSAGTAGLFPGVLCGSSQEQPGLGLGGNEVLLGHFCWFSTTSISTGMCKAWR